MKIIVKDTHFIENMIPDPMILVFKINGSVALETSDPDPIIQQKKPDPVKMNGSGHHEIGKPQKI